MTRMKALAFLATATVSISISLAAQNPAPKPSQTAPPSAVPPKMDQMEEAHRGIFGTPPSTSADSVRLSNAVAGSLPAGTPVGKIPRRNYIDEIIFGRIERDKVPHAGLTSDTEFVRRVYLDATGELPTAEAVRDFVASTDPAKRDKLIDSLIGTEEFAEVWAWFYGDLFRLGGDTGYGRNAFQYWNKEWLKLDRPYNEVVYDLLTPSAKSHSAIPALGLVGRNNIGLNNLPKDPDDFRVSNRLDVIDDLSIDIARLFLGINTSCVSCHDGAGHLEQVNLYMSERTREEFAKQSAFFGKFRSLTYWSDRSKNTGNDDQVVDDLAPGYNTGMDAPFVTASDNRFPRDGRSYEPAFILTGEKPRPGENPRAALARIMTNHIQFSRATVNMIWGKLMTVAFVEPYDGFDLARLDPKNPPPRPWTLQPTNPELLDALARDFQASNYSMHHLMKTIMKSSAYQLSARFPGEWKDTYTSYYPRKFVRLMTGPEVVDAISKATGRPSTYAFSGIQVSRMKEMATPGGTREVTGLMQAFFQSNRNTQVPDGNRPSTLQALLMTNSKFINEKIAGQNGSRVAKLLEGGLSNEQLVEELFLSSLGRWPSSEEKEVAYQALEKDRKRGAENIQWALLNSIEFVLNH